MVGTGAVVRFEDGPTHFDSVPVKSLITFDVNFYDTEEMWKSIKEGPDDVEEKVPL